MAAAAAAIMRPNRTAVHDRFSNSFAWADSSATGSMVAGDWATAAGRAESLWIRRARPLADRDGPSRSGNATGFRRVGPDSCYLRERIVA